MLHLLAYAASNISYSQHSEKGGIPTCLPPASYLIPFMESIGLFSTFLTRENTKNVNHADPDPDIPIHEIGATIVRPLSIKFNSIIDNETNGLKLTFSISAAKSKIQ